MPFMFRIDPNHRPPGILKRKTLEAGPHPCKHGATPGDPKKETAGRRRGGNSSLGVHRTASRPSWRAPHCIKTSLGHLPSAFRAGTYHRLAGHVVLACTAHYYERLGVHRSALSLPTPRPRELRRRRHHCRHHHSAANCRRRQYRCHHCRAYASTQTTSLRGS